MGALVPLHSLVGLQRTDTFWGQDQSVAGLDIPPLISSPRSVCEIQAQKHNAPLVALDFSEDSNYVQSASEDNELLYRGCFTTTAHVFFVLASYSILTKLNRRPIAA